VQNQGHLACVKRHHCIRKIFTGARRTLRPTLGHTEIAFKPSACVASGLCQQWSLMMFLNPNDCGHCICQSMQARASHVRTQSALEGTAAHAGLLQGHQQDAPSLPKVASHARSASAGPVNGILPAAGAAAGGAAGSAWGPQQQQQEAAPPEKVRCPCVLEFQGPSTRQQLLRALPSRM
jgi:hypothetical protein